MDISKITIVEAIKVTEIDFIETYNIKLKYKSKSIVFKFKKKLERELNIIEVLESAYMKFDMGEKSKIQILNIYGKESMHSIKTFYDESVLVVKNFKKLFGKEYEEFKAEMETIISTNLER